MTAIRKEILTHFVYWFALSLFFAVIHRHFTLPYLPFWLGGLFGLFLPDLDHLIYIYTKPNELTSKRVNYLADKKELVRAISLLYDTRNERKNLIFHTVFFQVLFVILTFWIMSSSGSLFGRGLVFSFSIHLLVDQIIDIVETGSFDNWLNTFPIKMSFEQSKIYWIVMVVINLIIGLFI